MLDTPLVRSLHLYSLKSLLTDLVSGRAVGIDAEGRQPFSVRSTEARALLDWYRNNERSWSQVSKEHLPLLVQAVAQVPPNLAAPATSASATPKAYLPKKVQIHGFGGIQEHGCTETLEIDLEKPLLLLEGYNGSGKTSILNAVVWCLTGRVYRAMRAPADGHEKVDLRKEASAAGGTGGDEDGDEDVEGTGVSSVLVSPVPPRSAIDALAGKPLPLDTWVSITFEELGSGRTFDVRRHLKNGRGGKPGIKMTGFENLSLDPVALEVGTVMPGLLPHIVIGEESDLGRAIAELTGLAPLRKMVKHAKRAKERIEQEYIPNSLKQVEEADKRFADEKIEIVALGQAHPDLFEENLASIESADPEAVEKLKAVASFVRERQALAFAGAQELLGSAFEPTAAASCQMLFKRVPAATAALETSAIATLPTMAILGKLNKLSEQELTDSEALVRNFRAEARELRALAADTSRASRLRLYTRIANWLRENGKVETSDTCPACLQPFNDKIDPATGRRPSEHLKEALEGGKEFLEKTLAAWASDVLAILSRDLPESLSRNMKSGLSASPSALLRQAFVNELFATEAFSDVLSPLKDHVATLCAVHLQALPPFTDPPIDTSMEGEPALTKLETELRNVDRAIAFARWRRVAGSECVSAFNAIIGQPGQSHGSARLNEQPLRAQIEALSALTKAAEPSEAALRHIDRMLREISIRQTKVDEIKRAKSAAKHLQELFPISDLVQAQISSLRQKLDGDTQRWMKAVYQAATTGTAPKPRRSAVDSAGKLDFQVERHGTLVSAEHVGNASFLRAYLLAFLLAFWEHVRRERGGLSLLVLDDPQEMLDPNNRRRLAATFGTLVESGSRLLISTHDSGFALEVCATRYAHMELDHRSVHGRNHARPCVQLAPAISDLDRKKSAFENDVDNHGAARDYANNFRIFAEARISDFIDRPAHSQPKAMMLNDLLIELSRLHKTADAFSGPAFKALVEASSLQSGSPFRDLLNKVHHRNAAHVLWADVDQHRERFGEVRKLILDAHDEYRRWIRRDLMLRATAPVTALNTMHQPPFGVLHREMDLAAFSASDGQTGGEGSGEALDAGWFSDKSLFVLTADTLGFAAPRGSALMVESTSGDVEDHRLVVALHKGKIYARRLLRSTELAGRVVLVAETENPLDRPPPVVLPENEVHLHKVVGVVFGARAEFSRDGNEARLQDFHSRLKEIKRVHQAHGTSGVPLVLDGQTVLGGNLISADQMDAMRGHLAAVCTADGDAFFKRIGEALPGLPHLRLFENVGGLGDSQVITFDDESKGSSVPQFKAAREIVGVLYT